MINTKMKTTFICLIFFISGAAALIFETVWFKELGLMLGNSVWASSIVFASFMGGLALGNFLAAKYGEKIKRLLLTYALLEFLIAAIGFALVLLFPQLTKLLVPFFKLINDSSLFLNVARLAVAFLLMLIPTAAMGATLPILTKELSRTDPNFGKILGRLYGWNTLGAVFGAVSVEYFFIKTFGIVGSGFIAALFGLFAAASIWIVSKKTTSFSEPEEEKAPVSAGVILIMLAAFLGGFILLAAEVVWLRLILLFVYGTSLVFALMLAAALGGISLGGLAASFWLKKRPNDYFWVSIIASIAGSVLVFTYLHFDFAALQYKWTEPSQFKVLFPLISVIVFPTAFLSGILFTLLGSFIKHILGAPAKSAGFLTLANTLGGMFGAFIAGFILLPYVGIEKSIFFLSIGYLLIAMLILFKRQVVGRVVFRGSLIVFLLSLIFIALFPFGKMEKDYFKYPTYGYQVRGEKLVEAKEGLTETIFYTEKNLLGKPLYHRLITNSYSMSSNSNIARRYMKLYVYLPVALHSDLKDALLISYGVGSTAKALTDTDSIEKIDVVDISKDILEANRFAFKEGEFPLDDPRVTTHIEDGRYFLLTTDKKYDLITAEPPPPKNAGITNLYSQEYFELLYDHLNGGGMVTYWLPVMQLYPEETKSIIRAFCNAFEDCSLWNGSKMDWMLMGSKGSGEQVEYDHFVKQWLDPNVKEELVNLGFESPELMGSLFIADAVMLDKWTEDMEPLTDNYPYRISATPTNYTEMIELYSKWNDSEETMKRFQESEWVKSLLPDRIQTEAIRYFPVQGIINEYVLEKGDHDKKIQDLHYILTNSPFKVIPLWLLGSDGDIDNIIKNGNEDETKDPKILEYMAAGALAKRNFSKAAKLYKKIKEMKLKQYDYIDKYYQYCLARNLGMGT